MSEEEICRLIHERFGCYCDNSRHFCDLVVLLHRRGLVH